MTTPLRPDAVAWWAYVQYHRGTDSLNAIARNTGIRSTTISRWQQSPPSIESVRAFATAYERPMIEAYLNSGYLLPSDAEMLVVETPPRELTRREMLARLTADLRQLDRIELREQRASNGDR